ncbi:DNA-directed RNA polymerase subunit beta [Collinsella sp. AF19-7AC]|uniref:DNA-directed RNA polymerase subunit beta n=4 Tax=Collinsella aerofaciens TaxID=74426 RepID=A0A858BA27_COLAA|nr:DNA-directed RNA polymerase subunit beta [Collinsella sp.]MBU9000804.1 DNA-directed RNA polymerase subunit beta [Collinsella aerofaciens]MBU9063568.1 DNA-directed RNA polymerase subunit beta [Collinsella sp. MSK.8.10]QIA34756.1 DNA-directed RNA polymerase subunit beta [Collinsella aerofaciens ATCC 25986]RGJ12490.1 DNA-directed RNA polymerase subunit beta [Collinsella sp. TM09-10AT]RGM33185.1 DNA-directed RNA polymerase subunit beta [Collinsella sp. OM08-14AT]RGT01726.1 DNA-directed RNA pol
MVTYAYTATERKRVSFGKIPEAMELPNLISVQRESFERFKDEGLREAFKESSPIQSQNHVLEVTFGEHQFGDPAHTVEECREKDMTYQAPLLTDVRLTNKETGEIKEQLVFMGDFPMMTDQGTFIINGTERIVVSQLVRSPGVYYSSEMDSGKQIYKAQIIPSRGAWLEFEVDKRDQLMVSIDRKRKQSATMFLRALGIAVTNDDIIELLGNSDVIKRTLERDTALTREDALIEIYRRLRPGEPPTVDASRSLLEGLLFNPQRYDLARVGRYKVNKKLNLTTEEEVTVLTDEDIVATLRYLLSLAAGEQGFKVDDIDHFGNRRIRTVGELVANQFRIGMSRMERVVRERMSSQDIDEITPQSLINIRPIVASIKEFFGSSQLSQFMDQANPLTGLTHKRRLSALGPGGLAGHKSGSSRRTNVPTAVRDVHNSHYSRMCPIETPEGPNIGLIGSLALYARVNEYGFIEAPFRRVENGVATDQIDWMTADEEEKHVIAPANTPLDPKTNEFITTDAEGKIVRPHTVIARTRDFDGSFGAPADVPVEDVDYMDVSPRQMLSVAATLIPFLEHDDAKRTLMGANMQRQAVPLVHPAAPYVGTGMERRAALDSGEVTLAKNAGEVIFADAAKIIVKHAGGMDEYHLAKYQRSNQSTCINHRPLVRVGDTVEQGEPLADGPSTDHGELALGQNLTVAYMPWEGFNYEDGIVVSERLVAEDLLTTINITRHEIDARDTKLGPEEITREIPNLSEDMLANLDEDGIIRIGAEVGPGDILVGKVTPKGESALTAEERLLRAIFGAKAHDVRDTSLKMPHGAYGRVIDVVRFSRENGDDLAPGVNEQVRVYVAQRRKIQQGDKIAGRHGNKGVICNVLPVEDMPYMADGTPIDVILNPLGVPSRMNVGQLLECHLGWAAACGWDTEQADSDKYVPGPFFTATPVFDGAKEDEIAEVIRRANKNMLNKATAAFGDHMRPEFVTQLDERGKTRLFDGRTGEEFREPITVGTSYILKLGHMVDDKIHARSTGPYSLVTQQPLGGKAQFGGQRFGEMEVWALYAYGASNVLQEILTVKSDDTVGRVKTYESIVKGENVPVPGIPESFKVLVKEIRSLALDIEPMHDADEDASAPVTAEETSALDDLAALAGVDADVEAEDAETAEAPEAVAATTTDKE